MTRTRTLSLLIALILSLAFVMTPVLAQDDPVMEEKYKNGFLPTGTYAGPFTKVNLHNGNFIINLPLFSLPGRAGHNLSLGLSYNSKQLVREQDGSQWVGRWFHEGPTAGRWVLNAWPSLQEEDSYTYYFTTPSGAVHKLTGQSPSAYCTSKDGTNIRYHITTKRVEFFGGSVFDFSDYDTNRKIYHQDRNGNRITYEFHATMDRPAKITDTLGREVLLAYNASPDSYLLDTITVKNHAGTDLVYDFDFVSKVVSPAEWLWTGYGYVRYYDCEATEVSGSQKLLSKLTLPNGQTYEFTYQEDEIETYYDTYVYRTTAQLETLTLPSEAEITYEYNYLGVAANRLSKYVTSVETDPVGGGAFTTSYSYTTDANGYVTETEVTRADGSLHITDWNPSTDQFSPFLREQETFTDTDGTTDLLEVDTSWADNGEGDTVDQVTVRDVASGLTQWTQRVTDDYGREVEKRVYEAYNKFSITYRRFDLTSNYTSRLLEEEQAFYDIAFGYPYERVLARTEYQYDQFTLTDRGTVTQQASGYGPTNTNRGNVTTVRSYLVDEDRYVESKSYYDTVGNVVETRDPLNRATTIAYSSTFHYAYPTQVSNGLSHSTQTNYNFNTGLVVSTTDPNSQSTTYQYGTYNRVTRQDSPNGGYKTWYYKDDLNAGNSSKFRSYARTDVRHTAGVTVSRTYQYADGLGRPLRTLSVAPDGSDIVDREYEICSCTGKTGRVSMPYRYGVGPVYWTETQYDGLGRVKKIIPPDGSVASNNTEYKYAWTSPGRRVEAVFDAKGIGKAYVYDVWGRLTETRENASYADLSSSTVTTYDHEPDTSSYRTKTVQRYNSTTKQYQNEAAYYAYYNESEINQGVQTRTFVTDSLGRLLEETHPENGTNTYTWYDNGLLGTKTDARSILTTMTYDTINRPSTVTYSDSTPTVTYTYDSGTYGTGRVYSVANSNATTTYTYDQMGFVTNQAKNIGGVNFSTSSSYNYAGQPLTTTLPNTTTLSYGYDRMARLTQITSDWVDANHPATLANNFVYHASGTFTSVDYGNGTQSTRTFNSGMQLKTLKHGTSGTPGQYLDFEYDYDEGTANNGRIMEITDYNDTTKTISYTYDNFYRLATAETQGSHWGLSYGYDRYGNLLTKTLTKGSGPSQLNRTANTSTNRVNGWGHDAAGNVTNPGGHTYNYDANNMVTQIDSGATQYKYDSAGSRVMKVNATETIYYVGGAEFSSVSGWKKVYVHLGSEKLIEYSNSTTYFYHADHLGSPRVQTDMTGTVVETWDNYPFGEQWQRTGINNNEHRYTGHLRDPETGNEYAGARYYNGARTRWMSVDPVLGNTANPQDLNRYAYVLNDPVNFWDPDGRRPVLKRQTRGPGWEPPPGWEEIEFGPKVNNAPPGGWGTAQPNQEQEPEDNEQATPTIGLDTRVLNAIAGAISILETNAGCREFLGDQAANQLSAMLEGGRIREWNLGMPLQTNDGTIDAKTAQVAGNFPNNIIFFNTFGPFYNPLNTFVETPTGISAHNFLNATNSRHSTSLNVEQFRQALVLHEVGHIMGVLPSDAHSIEVNQNNTGLILQNCFGADSEPGS